MIIKALSDRILFDDKRKVLQLHLYTKLLEKGVKPYKNDMDILIDLYLQGGYHNAQEQAAFIQHCLHDDRKYLKSEQSVRNMLTRYTNLKILHRPKNSQLVFNEEYLPSISFDQLVLRHIISHQ